MKGGDTELQKGMVFDIQQKLQVGLDEHVVHRESLVVTEKGCESLGPRPPKAPVAIGKK